MKKETKLQRGKVEGHRARDIRPGIQTLENEAETLNKAECFVEKVTGRLLPRIKSLASWSVGLQFFIFQL